MGFLDFFGGNFVCVCVYGFLLHCGFFCCCYLGEWLLVVVVLGRFFCGVVCIFEKCVYEVTVDQRSSINTNCSEV